MKLCRAEHVAQKARREVEAKAKAEGCGEEGLPPKNSNFLLVLVTNVFSLFRSKPVSRKKRMMEYL